MQEDNTFRIRKATEAPIWQEFLLREEFSSLDQFNSDTIFQLVKNLLESQEVHEVSPDSHGIRCVDGRINYQAHCSLGGDFCEFLLVLQGVEQMLSCELTTDQVSNALKFYVFTTKRQFYWHTDQNAMEMTRRVAGLLPRDMEAFSLVKPCYQSRVISALQSSTACLGCHHLRLLLNRPDEFKIRPDLIYSLIHAFMKLYWNRSNMLSDFLVLEVLQPQTEDARSMILFRDADAPPVLPSSEASGARTAHYIYHHAIALEQRAEKLNLLASNDGLEAIGLTATEEQKSLIPAVSQLIDDLADQHCLLMLRYSSSAGSLPLMQVHRGPPGSYPRPLYLFTGQRDPALDDAQGGEGIEQ